LKRQQQDRRRLTWPPRAALMHGDLPAPAAAMYPVDLFAPFVRYSPSLCLFFVFLWVVLHYKLSI
jgi:hypothetical protein